MKKTFTITSILGLLASSNSFAKTSGNYAAINFIGTKIESSGTQAEIEEDMSFGVDYKYAFNKKRFFIAPGVFYDHNSNTNTDHNLNPSLSEQLRYSYGLTLTFGYDVTYKINAYGVIGHSLNRISTSRANIGKEDSTTEAFTYGIGASYTITETIGIKGSYNFGQYGKGSDLFNSTDEFNSDYHLGKAGIFIKF